MADSGSLFEVRVARSRTGAAALGASRRAAAGFLQVGGTAEGGQEYGKGLTDPAGREAVGWPRPLPRQPAVVDDPTREAELGVGDDHQPGPAVGLLGVTDPGRRPVEHLFAEAERVFQVEAAHVGAPDQVQVGRPGPAPAQPELLRGAGLGWQALDLD